MNSQGTGEGNGQAPTSPTPNGQAPTETPPQTPNTPNGQAPTTPSGEDASAARLKVIEAELAEARREAAALRTAEADRKKAELTEAERAKQEAQEAKAALEAARATLLERDIAEAARKAGITEPDLAALDIRAKVKVDASGQPTNLDALIKAFTEAHPSLVAPAPGSNQGRANAPRDAANTPKGRVYTQAELEDFSFYLEHQADIEVAMREGRIKTD